MEVKLVSECCIKPSSQTPDHLRTHKLSLLDQFVPPMQIPVALVYSANPDRSQTSNDTSISQRSSYLKQSLSETLTRFYPFAGKIKDNLSIDCNDEGAYYVEARINCPLSEYLNDQSSDLSLMRKFLPTGFSFDRAISGSFVSMVQETSFTCGGMIICLIFSHMVVDGTALSCFLKAWSAMASKSSHETEAMCPKFDAGSVFLPNEAYPREATLMAFFYPFVRTSRSSTRRFVFDASTVANLKAKARSSMVENPTRVEAVSAILCKCIMAIYKARSGGVHRPTVVTHAMNLRRRALPPFPGCTMGNFVWSSIAICTTEDPDLASLVCQLRESVQKIDSEFVRKLQGDGGLVNLCDALQEMAGSLKMPGFSGRLGHVGFTSWCNFGLYDIDFGWGKPAWVTPVTSNEPQSPFLTTIYLMDSKRGNGIEAIVSLDEDEMVNLEHDQELLAYASINPNPLNVGN